MLLLLMLDFPGPFSTVAAAATGGAGGTHRPSLHELPRHAKYSSFSSFKDCMLGLIACSVERIHERESLCLVCLDVS